MKCIHCGDELIKDDNWLPGCYNYGAYRCRHCHNKQVKHRKSSQSFEQRLRHKISQSLSAHRKRGIETIGSITEYVHTYTGECAFCGLEFDIFSKDRMKSGSMDRINNRDIMSPDDIQWLCYKCNTTKGDRTNAEFLEYINDIKDKLEALKW